MVFRWPQMKQKPWETQTEKKNLTLSLSHSRKNRSVISVDAAASCGFQNECKAPRALGPDPRRRWLNRRSTKVEWRFSRGATKSPSPSSICGRLWPSNRLRLPGSVNPRPAPPRPCNNSRTVQDNQAGFTTESLIENGKKSHFYIRLVVRHKLCCFDGYFFFVPSPSSSPPRLSNLLCINADRRSEVSSFQRDKCTQSSSPAGD